MNVSEHVGSLIFDTPVRERLQIFLQSSALYDAVKAILYRRLGQETLVLDILALKLENFEAAENYCAEVIAKQNNRKYETKDEQKSEFEFVMKSVRKGKLFV